MSQTIEVEIDASGRLHPVEPSVRVPPGRALLTMLDSSAKETLLLAEPALADEWLKPDEDQAWAHLQPGK